MAGDRHGKHNTTTISFRVNSYEKATIYIVLQKGNEKDRVDENRLFIADVCNCLAWMGTKYGQQTNFFGTERGIVGRGFEAVQ